MIQYTFLICQDSSFCKSATILSMSSNKWRLVNSQIVFDTPYLVIKDNDYLLPNSKKAEHFYQLVRNNYVLVIVQNDQGEILIEKQYRWGVDDFVYELPAGWINESEDSVDAAKREVVEETGYIVRDVVKLGKIYPQPGFCTMHAIIFKAEIESQKTATPEFDEEDTEMEFMSLEKIKSLVKDGTIRDMGLIAALSFL